MKALATALAKAQAEIKAALKDSKNPHFKSSYADLTSVWDACRTALTKNGLSVIQKTDFAEGEVWLETILLHADGDQITGRYPLRPQQQTPQGYGSALTYARRYSLAAMVGVVADEDDDGNAASAPRSETIRQVEAPANTMASRKNEGDGKARAEAYVKEQSATLRVMKTLPALNEWIEAQRDTLERLERAFPDGHTKLMDLVAETSDRLKPARSAAE